MMFHANVLLDASIAYYGAGMAVCMRRDLVTQYSRIIADVAQVAEDGLNMMISNGWMEQPPQADDRKALVRV